MLSFLCSIRYLERERENEYTIVKCAGMNYSVSGSEKVKSSGKGQNYNTWAGIGEGVDWPGAAISFNQYWKY